MKYTERARERETLLIYASRVASSPESLFKFPLPAAHFVHSPHPEPFPGQVVQLISLGKVGLLRQTLK